MRNLFVAHSWATKSCNSAKGKNFYFKGATIYCSSDFPIAKHLDHNTVLFTNGSHPKGAKSHIDTALSAIRDKKLIYVPHVLGSKDENFKIWTERLEESVKMLNSAKVKEPYAQIIKNTQKDIFAYIEYFNLTIPTYIIDLIMIVYDDEYKLYLKARKEKQEKKRIREERKKLGEQKAIMEEWKAFKIGDLPYMADTIEGYSFLRYNKRDSQIETSQGHEFPLSSTYRLWQYIESILDSKSTFEGYWFHGYQIKELNKDFLLLGCHKIHIKEIESMVKLLGW